MIPKIFHDSIHGPVDMSEFLPIIHTEIFQRLLEKKQLGTNYKIFEDATHTRFSHSIGSCHQNRKLTEKLSHRRGDSRSSITKEEKKASDAYALLHDIGHPAFSHVVEPLCPYNNDEQGQRLIGRLKKEIERCGVDFDLLREIFEHRNPLHLITHDKNLGMEKMDYLMRDGTFSGEGQPPNPDHLLDYIYFTNKRLEIDNKIIDYVKRIQDFYIHMYKNVYLRKKSLIVQRLMQKMVYELVAEEEVRAEELMDMVDYQLLAKLEGSSPPHVKYLFKIFSLNWPMFKEAIVICYDEFADNYRVAGKAIHVQAVDDEIMKKFITAPVFLEKNPGLLRQTERTIEKIAGVPEFSVLVVPVVSPERFIGKDVHIHGSQETLKQMFPRHYEGMDEVGRNYAVLRVCASINAREKLARPDVADMVFRMLVRLMEKEENSA